MQRSHRVGIMGGTFDPIHLGHLVTAEAARSEFALEKVIFVPSGHPPHKKMTKITDKEFRYQMTFLATAANPYFEVSRTEIDRVGESFTIDTVRYMKEKMPPGGELYFITGADAILEIVTWKNVHELLDVVTFIAATRPGYDLIELKDRLSKKLGSSSLDKIIPLEVPAMAISSTDIRNRMRTGRSIKYLLPDSVENFIDKNNLYHP
ncbi:MAG: nicotinate-nucleotide adenylyltransferase [Clostridia bacterium]|nr:nicotinate-nucleotide adenylyltransferase [Clostridia bacterium]